MHEGRIVVTDMDGSLLNHNDYRYDAVLPELKKLRCDEVPVILNSSKTRLELEGWRDTLSLSEPFVTENGSAIFFPRGYFNSNMLKEYTRLNNIVYYQRDTYDVIELGCGIEALQQFYDSQKVAAIDFSRCSVEMAMDITGLDRKQALLAQQREYSIPLLFDEPETEQLFIAKAHRAGFGTLKGGRFLHLLGKTDKGRSVRVLRALYESLWGRSMAIIALGDSDNDKAMLQEADVAVCVANPASTDFTLNHQHFFVTCKSAPEGWVEGVQKALKLLH